ncbi:MAG: VWA domain-containing protein [Bacteroidetes bacterium]|nr:VWA domain-containing protein [Bacteroidota bacterium]
MSVQFFTEYPLWFLVFCIAAGGLYSFVLYRRGHGIVAGIYQKILIWILSILRFFAVTIIAFLLLNPLLKFIKNEVQKPFLILGIDNSNSILNTKDSTFYRQKITEIFNTIEQKSGNNVKVEKYLFGKNIQINKKPDFVDKQTDISSFFDEILNVYSSNSSGGIILLTDGIYNKGNNPVYSVKNLKFPVFAIGLGDTSTRKDLKITNIRTNSIAYLNNSFPAQIDIKADKCTSQAYNIKVFNDEKLIHQNSVTPATNSDFYTLTLNIDAQKPGIMHLSVIVSNLNGEITYTNNRKDFFIDVIDARQKILISAKSPHPDLAALKQAFESNKNYQTEIDFNGNFTPEKLNKFDLVVLHQMPSNGRDLKTIEMINNSKIPMLFVLGRQTNLNLFNTLKSGLTFNITGNGYNQSTAIINSDFNLFEFSESVKSTVPYFPPLAVGFGNFIINDKSKIMLFQQIGSVKTEQPLICFNDNNNTRNGFITGEGLWRWRLIDFEKNQNHNVTNDLISKIVQYMTAVNDKRKLRVYTSQNTFNEDENILFNAEYYNQSYELVNKPDISLTITNPKGKNYTYNFSRTENAYKLDAGTYLPGRYNYIARVAGDNTNSAKGSFLVKPLQVEYTETKANHEMLKNIANNTSGKFLKLEQIDELLKNISKNSSFKSVIFSKKEFSDLINRKWVFFLILSLLSLEWFLRKRSGSY